MIERIGLEIILFFLRLVRRALQSEPRIFALLGAARWQRLLEWIGRVKALEVYHKAKLRCPAYAAFLKEHGAPDITSSAELSRLPQTNKENYVKKFSIEDRCYGGRIPSCGVVIDESSGSSGAPNSWVRGPGERSSVKAMMQVSFSTLLAEPDYFILNCFALGPWATGMNVSMSLVDLAIMKSIGPDKAKLENALRQFGTKYRYLIAGYPPFVKNFLDTTTLDLSGFELHLIVGGEAMSEGLREYFSKWFRSVVSSYGASDLEINIGAETEFAIALRKHCWRNPQHAKAIFGREDPPMIFQYNPLDYLIERDEKGELVFTISRLSNVAPKIRYNLHDSGGVFRFRDLLQKLRGLNIDIATWKLRLSHFPVLFVYGRNDLTVPFFGAKIFTSDLDHIIHQDARLSRHLNSFQISSVEDEKLNRRLELHLERAEGSVEPLDARELRMVFFNGLTQVNQDFREITKMITVEHIAVILHEYGTGPFAKRDIRVKSQYIGGS